LLPKAAAIFFLVGREGGEFIEGYFRIQKKLRSLQKNAVYSARSTTNGMKIKIL
jgi:hypothetical protein